MLKKLLFVGMILVLMASFSVVLADQDGNDCWCNVDKDGCWVTNEEGGRDYLMFWSEESRKFFMGDITAPYTNVVSMAEGARLGLICGVPEEEPKQLSGKEALCVEYVDVSFQMGLPSPDQMAQGQSYWVGVCVAEWSEEDIAEFLDDLKNPTPR